MPKKNTVIYSVRYLEDGVWSYDCALCGVSCLDSDDIKDHIGKDHIIETHSSDDCPDIKNHEDHYMIVRRSR